MGGSRQSELQVLADTQGRNQGAALSQAGLNEIESILGSIRGKWGGDWGKIPGEIGAGYDKARAATESAFQNAGFGASEATRYLAKTGGNAVSGGEINTALARDANLLDQRRRQAIGQLGVDEANAAMSANNGFMRLISGAGMSALGLANTYQGQALSALQMVPDTNPWQSALSGAAAGASAGSVVPGWGTLIGAVAGGVGGYLAGRG